MTPNPAKLCHKELLHIWRTFLELKFFYLFRGSKCETEGGTSKRFTISSVRQFSDAESFRPTSTCSTRESEIWESIGTKTTSGSSSPLSSIKSGSELEEEEEESSGINFKINVKFLNLNCEI